MKKLITIILLLLTITVATAKDYELGYYIVLETGISKCGVIKTPNISDAEIIISNQFGGLYVNLVDILSNSRYFEMSDEHNYVYIEVRRITKKGKYRRIKRNKI